MGNAECSSVRSVPRKCSDMMLFGYKGKCEEGAAMEKNGS
jgi:hypothetical protein